MGMEKGDLVLGLDFGTDSVRALLVDARTGRELGSRVAYYKRWAQGAYCDPKRNIFRQHPLDYVEAMEEAVRELVSQTPGAAESVRGIGVDTTGSTPALADEAGQPLSLGKDFAENPDAMFILWKDHSGIAEAEEINALAHGGKWTDYTRYVGGIYSSEWYWAKALRVARVNPRATAAAYTFIEHCDWVPAILTGAKDAGTIKRGRCAAGHKALWHRAFGGYPSADFLSALHPELARLGASLGSETYTSDQAAGVLCPEWQERLGIRSAAAVAVGAYDAHMGAVGGGVGPGTFLRIMGTSTCDVMVGPLPAKPGEDKVIAGICGQVDGSVIPGMMGYEAGQSAYGDIFAWFKRLLAWPLGEAAEGSREKALADGILPALDRAAAALPAGPSSALALDWLNGRRTPDADQALTGAVMGLGLGTDAPTFYRALVEAAAYGSRAIVERFESEGLAIQRVAAIGGVAKKSPFVMQVLCDVLNRSIDVMASDQACALGAAIFGAVAAGIYPDALTAQKVMASKAEKSYQPDAAAAKAYAASYQRYLRLARFVEGETKLMKEGR